MFDTSVDLRIEKVEPLISPQELGESLPIDEALRSSIRKMREDVNNIIKGKDKRLLAIIGPCSIHDVDAAIDYAKKLKALAEEVEDQLVVVMRTYFEKPRTIGGWKGLIIDPRMDGSYDITEGLKRARKLLISITTLGLPVGAEMLDPIVPQYIDETLSWCSIGARTTESQVHRTLASGMSVPVGFKNSTSGEVSTAINAIKSASLSAAFIGIDKLGSSAIYRTKGNDAGHLILRGGDNGPNYYDEEVEDAIISMKEIGVRPSIIIDCSHANSRKNYKRQERILNTVIDQVVRGRDEIRGFMIESNLFEGCQSITEENKELLYGVSVTDACLGWSDTERAIKSITHMLRNKETYRRV
ncbi:MAG: 3-deoxy-7-phosphoheptulonate synthase [Spirochaetia bacterium]|nr:3-deoxy-7-phosphoheptulonate synthase [Spirochaetia bacterium]